MLLNKTSSFSWSEKQWRLYDVAKLRVLWFVQLVFYSVYSKLFFVFNIGVCKKHQEQSHLVIFDESVDVSAVCAG